MKKRIFAGILAFMLMLTLIPVTNVRADEVAGDQSEAGYSDDDSDEKEQSASNGENDSDEEKQPVVNENDDSDEEKQPVANGDETPKTGAQPFSMMRAAENAEKEALIGSTEYATLEAAVNAAQAGDVISLIGNVTLESTLTINEKVTITSTATESYKISAGDNFSDTNLIEIADSSAEVTLGNVTLNANKKCRVVMISAGKLIVNGATITGGKAQTSDKHFQSGVCVTGSASFEMNGGEIKGNESAEDTYYKKYCSDLWIGANATGSIASINGGTVGKVFVNANEWSQSNPGSFTVDGGTIEELYVEYDQGYGALFTFKTGTIKSLLISKTESGQSDAVTALAGTVYRGGFKDVVAEVDGVNYTSLQDAVNAANGKIVKLTSNADITKEDVTIAAGQNVTLDLNGKTLKAANTAKGHIKVNGNLTFKDSVGGGKLYTETPYVAKTVCHGIIELDGGSMTMESGYINAVMSDPANNGQFAIVLTGKNNKFTMNGGKIEAGWYPVSGTAGRGGEGSQIIINAGELISTADYAIYSPLTNGTVSVNGGKVNGAAGAIFMNTGTLNITAGEVTSENTGSTGTWNDGTGYQDNAAISLSAEYGEVSCKITGGTITGGTNTGNVAAPSVILGTNEKNGNSNKVTLNIENGIFKGEIKYADNATSDSKTVITGGNFDTSVKVYCADGYEEVKKSDNTYEVVAIDKTGNVAISVHPTATSTKVSDNISSDKAEDANKIANVIAGNENLKKAIAEVAANVAESYKNDEDLIADAKEKLGTEEKNNIQLIVKPRVEVSVQQLADSDLNSEDTSVIEVEIKLYYDVYAKKVNTEGSDSADEEKKLKTVSVSSTKDPVEISFEVSEALAEKLQAKVNANKKIYIKHPKANGDVYYHEASINGRIVTFTNNAGFSSFILMYGDAVPVNEINTPGGNEPGGNEPGGNEPGGNQSGGNEPGGNEPGGNQPGGSTDQPSGNQPGGSTDQPSGNQPGGSTDNAGGTTGNTGSSTDNAGGTTGNTGSSTNNTNKPANSSKDGVQNTSNVNKTNKTQSSKTVVTGDSTNILVYAVLMIVAAVGIGVLYYRKRRA